MLRKKQLPKTPSRNVRPQQTANVFSYYASRSSGDGSRTRRLEDQPAKRRRLKLDTRQWAAYIPSVVAGLALVVCLVYVSTLNGQPKLQIVGDQKNIGFVTGKDTYESDIRSIFNESVFNRSKLLINTDDLAADIQEKYPELGEVSVILPLVGQRPVVQVRPAEPSLILGTFQGGVVIDENGRTVADARDVDSSIRDTLPTVEDESGLSLERGGYALPGEAVSFIRIVAEQLAAGNIEVQSMTLPAVANEMHVRLNGRPYYVKFDMRGEGRVQVGTLIATKEKLEKDGTVPRVYVDVRIPGKVFYK